MFQSPTEGAGASTILAVHSPDSCVGDGGRSLSDPRYETVRHMVFGSLVGVRGTIQQLYQLNYAEPHAWSKPIPTGRPNEVMVILTKKIRLR